MKQVNNNFGAILAYGVPTALALLGLLWLLRRKNDDDDDDAHARKNTSKTVVRDSVKYSIIHKTSEEEGRSDFSKKKTETCGEVGHGDAFINMASSAVPLSKEKSAEVPVIEEEVSAAAASLTTSFERHLPQGSFSSETTLHQSNKSNTAVHLSMHVADVEKVPREETSNTNLVSDLKKPPKQPVLQQSGEDLKLDDAAILKAGLPLSEMQAHSRFPCLSSSTDKSAQSSASADLRQCSAELQDILSIDSVGSKSLPDVSEQSLSLVSNASETSMSTHQGSSDFSMLSDLRQTSTVPKESVEEVCVDAYVQSKGTALGGVQVPQEKEKSVSNSISVESPLSVVQDKSSSSAVNAESSKDIQSAADAESFELLTADRVLQAQSVLGQKDSSIGNTGIYGKNALALTSSSEDNKPIESKSAELQVVTTACKQVSSPLPTEKGEEADEKQKERDVPAKSQEASSGTETVTSVNTHSTTESVRLVSEDVKSETDVAASSEVKPRQDTADTATSVIAPLLDKKESTNKISQQQKSHKNQPPHSKGGKSKSASPQSKPVDEKPKASSPRSKSAPQASSQSPSKSSQSSSKSTLPTAGSGSRRRNRSGGSDRTPERSSVSRTSSGVTENGRAADSSSPVCDTNSEASNDSGRGGSVGETLVPLSAEVVRYDFNFPSELCGRLIGRGGKNIQHIKEQSGATITLSSNPFTPEFQICCVQGVQSEVDRALMMIRKKFPLAQYPRLDMTSLAPPPPAPVVLPEVMQLSLPEGVSIEVVVSTIVNAGHIFVQQPTHPSFPSLERLNHFMNVCYNDINTPGLPHPVEGGIICASESDGQWYRAQIVQVYPQEDECDIKFVDYGGYTRVPISTLKQIRSDFMTLPFQAVECYLANITPLQEEDFFSDNASEVLMELTSGTMLQGQVIGRGDDSISYVHLYRVSGHKVLMINREMVNREVVRWIEIL